MSDMGTTLAVDKAIDRQLDNLIQAAARQAQKTQGAADARSKSQIRNLVNVADHTQSLEAVTNFIRYQIGRDKSKVWKEKAFGKGVIDDIEEPDGVVKTALAAVQKAVPAADETAARAKIIALYVGYLNRCFVCAQNPQAGVSLSSALGLEGKG